MTSAWHMLSWLLLGLFGALLGVSMWIDSSLAFIPIPPFAWTVPLVLATSVIVVTWQVRAFTQGNRPAMSPLAAARIAIFSQACSRAGMLLGGIGVGAWIAAAGNHATYLDEQASRFLWVGLASLLLGGAGWLGEWWCSIDDDDEEAPPAAAGA